MSIVYDYETREYAVYDDIELIAFAPTYRDGELLLLQLAEARNSLAMGGMAGPPFDDPLPDPGPEGPGVPGDDDSLLARTATLIRRMLGGAPAANIIRDARALEQALAEYGW